MNKADNYIKSQIESILAYGYKDENPRPKYADGSPAFTYSVNHVLRTYDLSKGEFPICTLRPQAWKTGIKEMMAIYQNQSNKISEFERCGCGWWADWALEDGTIGKAYPYNLESHRVQEVVRNIIKVKPRIFNDNSWKIEDIKVGDLFNNPIEVYENYQLIKVNGKRYTIQSLHTGEIQTVYRNAWVKIKNNEKSSLTKKSPFLFDRNYYGIGYLGNYQNVNNFTQNEIEILKRKWVAMLKRCYSNDEYYSKYYNDTFVATRWHSFENFLQDIRYVPQYFLAREDSFVNWELDKDYYGSNVYSKESCVFLSSNDNKLYRYNKVIEVTKPNDEIEVSINLKDVCNKYNLNYGNAQQVLNGTRNHVHGYKFKKVATEDCLYRYELSRNQVVELIKDIQNNPYGRRHIMSFWNWANINKKSLVECAYETIWNVRNDIGGEYLDMCLIQRSGDMLTASGAGGINEIQYATLLMMIARHCGYKVGKFTHFVANEQIYNRHFEQANEMLRRFRKKDWEEYNNGEHKHPNLILNPEKTNFYDFTIDDFTMVNYEPMQPQLKLELGI